MLGEGGSGAKAGVPMGEGDGNTDTGGGAAWPAADGQGSQRQQSCRRAQSRHPLGRALGSGVGESTRVPEATKLWSL